MRYTFRGQVLYVDEYADNTYTGNTCNKADVLDTLQDIVEQIYNGCTRGEAIEAIHELYLDVRDNMQE